MVRQYPVSSLIFFYFTRAMQQHHKKFLLLTRISRNRYFSGIVHAGYFSELCWLGRLNETTVADAIRFSYRANPKAAVVTWATIFAFSGAENSSRFYCKVISSHLPTNAAKEFLSQCKQRPTLTRTHLYLQETPIYAAYINLTVNFLWLHRRCRRLASDEERRVERGSFPW